MTVTDAVVKNGMTAKELDAVDAIIRYRDSVVMHQKSLSGPAGLRIEWAERQNDYFHDLRTRLFAALAVQPVPTDAEIEQAIDRLALQVRMMMGPTVAMGDQMVFPLECVNEPCVKQRANLLRLIAAQRSAARREALEDALRAIDADIPDDPNTGVAFMLAEAGAKRARFIVSSMLAKEDGDE